MWTSIGFLIVFVGFCLSIKQTLKHYDKKAILHDKIKDLEQRINELQQA